MFTSSGCKDKGIWKTNLPCTTSLPIAHFTSSSLGFLYPYEQNIILDKNKEDINFNGIKYIFNQFGHKYFF